jgi:hypothetical protein
MLTAKSLAQGVGTPEALEEVDMDSHSTLGTHAGSTSLPAGRAGARFGFEVMAMCVVMCASGEALSFATFNGLGWASLVTSAPIVVAVLITAYLIVPMTVYMAIRGHAWRHTLTMDASTAAVGLLVMAGIAAGLLTTASLPVWHAFFGIICGPACVLMVVQMFRDRAMYGGTMQH